MRLSFERKLMPFQFVDRITEIRQRQHIQAVRTLTINEEYLQDHFPGFPVMPGVLMVESLVQASAWLLRYRLGFARSIVRMIEAGNVRYGRFVKPGDTLVLESKLQSEEGAVSQFRARARLDTGELVVAVNLKLESFNLSDKDPRRKTMDEAVRKEQRRVFDLLAQGAAVSDEPDAPTGSGGSLAAEARRG